MAEIEFSKIFTTKKIIIVFISSVFLITLCILSTFSKFEIKKTENDLNEELKITAEIFKKDISVMGKYKEKNIYQLFDENKTALFYFDQTNDELFVLIPILASDDEKNNFVKMIEEYINKNQNPDLLKDLKIQSEDSLSSINRYNLDKSQIKYVSYVMKQTLLSSIGSKCYDNDVSRIRNMFEYIQGLLRKSQEKVNDSFYVLFSLNKNIVTVDSFETSSFSSSEERNINKRQKFSFKDVEIAKNSFYSILYDIRCKHSDSIPKITLSDDFSSLNDDASSIYYSTSSVSSIENDIIKSSLTATNDEEKEKELIESNKKYLKNTQALVPYNKDIITFEKIYNYNKQQKEESSDDNYNNLTIDEISSSERDKNHDKREIKFDENGLEIKTTKKSEKQGLEINPNDNLKENEVEKTEVEGSAPNESEKYLEEKTVPTTDTDEKTFSKILPPIALLESDTQKPNSISDDSKSIDEKNSGENSKHEEEDHEITDGSPPFHPSHHSTMNEGLSENSINLTTPPKDIIEPVNNPIPSIEMDTENIDSNNNEIKTPLLKEIYEEESPILKNIDHGLENKKGEKSDSTEIDDEAPESSISDSNEEQNSYETSSTVEANDEIDTDPGFTNKEKPMPIIKKLENDDSDENPLKLHGLEF